MGGIRVSERIVDFPRALRLGAATAERGEPQAIFCTSGCSMPAKLSSASITRPEDFPFVLRIVERLLGDSDRPLGVFHSSVF